MCKQTAGTKPNKNELTMRCSSEVGTSTANAVPKNRQEIARALLHLRVA